MRTVTKRELNQDTASVLDKVTQTGEVVITERGTPRWRVTVVDGDEEHPLARLQREGRYTPPASTPTPWPKHPGGPAYTEAQLEELLAEMREDH